MGHQWHRSGGHFSLLRQVHLALVPRQKPGLCEWHADQLHVRRLGVADAGRADSIALYTGNDDQILGDLLTEFPAGGRTVRMSGGLLGHWSVWTSVAVKHLALAKQVHANGGGITKETLTLAAEITDSNAALFDAANGFHGCIAGLHEILRRQGLLEGRWCLDEHEDLSLGQMEEIDRVCRQYPHLVDDRFVEENLHRWLNA